MQFSWVLFSMNSDLRLSCLKLNLCCLLPHPSVLFVADLYAEDETSSYIQLLDRPDSLEVQVLGQSSISSQN